LSRLPTDAYRLRQEETMFQARVRVIYGDTDQMGVVYYANYLRYFEFARSEILRAHGRSYREMEAEGLSLPVVEATCRYLAPARYEDVLLVGIEVPEVSRVTLTFRYQVTREGESAVLCTGSTLHACLGRNGKPARLPDWVATLVT
jgi:acyl-CoA thioester hydrolase